jgi:anti-sigma28 factor (negative regulator of flagellin synthesis)
MDTHGRPADWRVRRLRELRRLVEAGLYTPDPERIARAMVSHARRTLALRLDVPRLG